MSSDLISDDEFGEHSDLRDAYHRHVKMVHGSNLTPEMKSHGMKSVNNLYKAHLAKRNPQASLYSHPELNEAAEMTHEARKTDPSWKPSWSKW